jgi:hypothetical protein
MKASERLRAMREAGSKPPPQPAAAKPTKHVEPKRAKPTPATMECPHCGKPIDMGQAMRAAGKKGGSAKTEKPKGFAAMKPERKSEIARAAAEKRWATKRKTE